MILGELGPYAETKDMLQYISGPYDMYPIDISGSLVEDISLETVIGSGAVGVIVVNNSGADGNILLKTVQNTYGDYITFPIKSSLTSGLLPRFTHIKKTGSISSAVILYQKKV